MDNINFMKMFLAMGSMTKQTREEKVAYKEQIIFSTPGIIKPEDWNDLTIEQKEKRLELVEKQINEKTK